MNYKKKYEEALERAKEIHAEKRAQPFDVMTKIFPEIKESEDERIWTINYLNNRKLNSSIIEEKESLKKAIAWLEKQGEQKPADKVEPKFKVGDWITDSIDVDKIIGIDLEDEDYLFENDRKSDISLVESISHIWTIQDAKDGDVLANDHHILILRELGYSWAANENPDSLYAYCGINPNGNFELEQKGYCFCGPLHTHPATKEQRDLLFQKMHEAGYEWDAEKKELKKIEQNPAWSEEDEYVFSKVLDWMLIVNPTSSIFEKLPKEQFIERFKSLKERYTWKPSDEQMQFLWKYAEQNNYDGAVLTSLFHDLKKLREE